MSRQANAREDSDQIKHLFDQGKLFAAMDYLQHNRNSVSAEREKMIMEEYAFYKLGQQILNRDRKEMQLFYKDEKNANFSLYLPNDVQSGHLAWYFNQDKLKLADYIDGCGGRPESTTQGKLVPQHYYKNSGIMNLIPYLLELNLMETWTNQIKKTAVRKQLDSTRQILHEVWDFPFPLAKREGNMYFQYFNLIRECGKIIFQSRTIDTTYKGKNHKYWLPNHVQKMGDDFLQSSPKHRGVQIDVDLFILEFSIHDQETISLRAFTNICPRVNISLPLALQKYQGKQMFLDWMSNFRATMGRRGRRGSKAHGFVDKRYVKVLQTLDQNPLRNVYAEWEADMLILIKQLKSQHSPSEILKLPHYAKL